MRNEFIMLERDFKRLYADYGLDEEVLDEIKDRLIYCWSMSDITDKEHAISTRVEYWLKQRASELGFEDIVEIIKNISPKPKVTTLTLTKFKRKFPTDNTDSFNRGYTRDDKGWLKSLKIKPDDDDDKNKEDDKNKK